MTTYNTGKPVGSSDPRDLYDNAENLDTLVNSPDKLEHDDRLGKSRMTWHGIEQAFQDFLLRSGYEDIGPYAAGLEITARNQIFLRSGEYYRARPSLALPYTTTGDWAAEGGSFVSAGDNVLRQELASANQGASLITMPGGSKVSDLESSEGAQIVGAKDAYGSDATIQEVIESESLEFPVSAYSQHSAGMVTGPLVVQLARKLRITGDPADAAYNHNVIANALAGLPNGAEIELPRRGLCIVDGGLVIDAYGVSIRGSNPGGAYDAFWLKFTDTGDAFTVKRPGFNMTNAMIAGASNPASGFGSDVTHDAIHIEGTELNIDAVITGGTLAFFRDAVTVKNIPGRNIKMQNMTFSGCSRAFSYTALGSAESRDFEFYDNRYHGIGREADERSSVIYFDPAANARGLTITGGLVDFSVELMRGYVSNTNISSVPMKGAQRGYIKADTVGHGQGLDRRGFNVVNGSFQMDGGRVLPESAISLKGGGFYDLDGFVSYGSAGHGLEIDSIDACISNTLIHNASQHADNTYSGYAIGSNAARVTFSGLIEYKQGIKGAPANKAKYAYENGGIGTRFNTHAMQVGLPSNKSYSVALGKASFGPDPSIQPPRTAYRDAIPTSGEWTAGDRIIRTPPAVGHPKAWACTSSGSPGTWVSEGLL